MKKTTYLKLRLIIWLFPFFSYSFMEFDYKLKKFIMLSKALVVFWIMISYIKNCKLNKFAYLILGFNIMLFISTVLNNGDYIRVFGFFCYTFVPYMLVEIYIKQNITILFSIISKFYFILIFINLVLFIKNPNGIYSIENNYELVRYNFLGLDNQIAPYMIGAIGLIIVNSLYKYNKLRITSIIMVIICILNAIQIWSVTLLVGISIFFIFYLVINRNQISNKILSPKSYILFSILTFILIYYFRIQELFLNLLNKFEKNTTLSGRDMIWSQSIDMIKQKLILGYGVQKSDSIVYFIQNNDYRNAHNLFLQIILICGLTGFILFLNTIYKSCKELGEYDRYKIVSCLSALIFTFMFIGLTEYYSNLYTFYIILTISSNIKSIMNSNAKFNKHYIRNGQIMRKTLNKKKQL